MHNALVYMCTETYVAMIRASKAFCVVYMLLTDEPYGWFINRKANKVLPASPGREAASLDDGSGCQLTLVVG